SRNCWTTPLRRTLRRSWGLSWPSRMRAMAPADWALPKRIVSWRSLPTWAPDTASTARGSRAVEAGAQSRYSARLARQEALVLWLSATLVKSGARWRYSPRPDRARRKRACSLFIRACSIGHHHRLANDCGHVVAMFLERVIHHGERRDLTVAQRESLRIPVAES